MCAQARFFKSVKTILVFSDLLGCAAEAIEQQTDRWTDTNTHTDKADII